MTTTKRIRFLNHPPEVVAIVHFCVQADFHMRDALEHFFGTGDFLRIAVMGDHQHLSGLTFSSYLRM